MIIYDKYNDYAKNSTCNIEYCMKTDIAQYAVLNGRWDLFCDNMIYIILSIVSCRDKIIEFIKAILLSNQYIRKMQLWWS